MGLGTHGSGTFSELTADNKAEFNKVNKINWPTKAQVEVGNKLMNTICMQIWLRTLRDVPTIF